MKRNKEKSISWSDQTIKEKSKERSKGQLGIIRSQLTWQQNQLGNHIIEFETRIRNVRNINVDLKI